MEHLKFYTKPECPLCDQVREVLENSDVEWEEINIYNSPEHLSQFRNEIPVLQSSARFWFYRERETKILEQWLRDLAR
jgi:glutaredoxin-related protein